MVSLVRMVDGWEVLLGCALADAFEGFSFSFHVLCICAVALGLDGTVVITRLIEVVV